jgi:hypothetical protein
MKKEDFYQDHRYTLTYTDSEDKLRPVSVYVLALHEDAMIVRLTEKEGILRKIPYDTVRKIVKSQAVSEQNRYYVPDAILAATHWGDKNEIQHYASAPNMGK